MLYLNYLGTSFCLLTYEKGMNFSSAIYHFIPISILIFFAFFRFSGIVKRAQKLEA